MTNPAAPVELVQVACPLCGGQEPRVLFTPWNLDVDPRTVLSASGGVRGTQTIVECRNCRLIYVNPRPRPEVVVESYAGAEDEVYVGAGAGRAATFRACMRLLERSVARGKLLDVGAAAGFFLKAAQEAQWEAVGVEPSRWLADYGRRQLQVTILPTTLREAHFPDGAFDIVTMWDVLEHVPDPLSELQEVRRVLRPGGRLLINYPDIGTWLARAAGKQWWFLLSVHLTYFTADTLGAMLQKAGFGDLRFRPHYQTLNLGHLIKMGGLYSPFLERIMTRVAHGLRISDWPIPYYASQTNVLATKL